MINKEYAKAYTEVIEIIKYVPEEDLKKIPTEKIEFYRNNMDPEYNYKLDMNRELEEQGMSEITKAVLANLFRDYWATPEQKEEIKVQESQELSKLEEEKREKYNLDELFKKKNEERVIENTNLPEKVKKESLFSKIISFFIQLFK